MNTEDKRALLLRHLNETIGSTAPRDNKKLTRVIETEPIAIIGVAGYLPRCSSVREFWSAIDNDATLIDEIPASRIPWDNIYDPTASDTSKSHTKWGGIIPDIWKFDANFFGILPHDAQLMDPRKRLLLTSVYHAIEDSGYAPASLQKSNTGVFVAIEEDEFELYLRDLGINASKIGYGNSSALLANQLSYHFDFRGPSEVINTMCSGGAVAIHRAVTALRSGEISLAVVGAANILLHEDPFVALSRMGQMSPVSEVNSFGAKANGWLRSDGVVSIILKPLSKAMEDHDSVYAVIKNTAVNYNGRGGMSIAAPNVSAHVDVIKSCYEGAHINPAQVRYIEAQGMGNSISDIAEWQAFNKALKSLGQQHNVTLKPGSCFISTLKPMTGHMHATSALGALLRIIRSFQTNRIHRILNLTHPNPDLQQDEQVCSLATDTTDWPEEKLPRLAGLHSYGSGGNNAHVLVEEFKPSSIKASTPSSDYVIPCSAETKAQCTLIVKNLLDYLQEDKTASIDSLAYTMQFGRDAMQYRIAFVVRTIDEFISKAIAFVERGEAQINNATFSGNDSDNLRIAAQWMKGGIIIWNKNQFGPDVIRLHLSGYPFRELEYCIDRNQPEEREKIPVTMSMQEKASCQNCNHCSNGCKVKKVRTSVSRNEKATTVYQSDETLPQFEHLVRDLLSSFLKVPPGEIELNKEFSAMGFDSMLVINLTQRLYEKYKLKLQPAVFFEHTTPLQLIHYLKEAFNEHFENTNKPAAQLAFELPPSVESNDSPHQQETAIKQNSFEAQKRSTDKRLPIAIIGVAGSFPDAPSINHLWENLIHGHCSIREVPQNRWDINTHFNIERDKAVQTGKSYGKWGGFIDNYFYFDPLFFNISPAETEIMSPKERLFLQCAWHALEDAGYTPQSLSQERVGVFAGVTRSGMDPYKVSPFTISNRVSYVLNFTGPSMTLDTACSSSLVAIHEACQHIYSGECTIALTGGVHVFLDPSHFGMLSGLHMLSPDGTSKPFGDNANGMVPGEGVGILMLKAMDRAVADGDHIYGVIKGSSTNHGGKTNGFTVPNPRAHRDLIQEALEKSGVNASQISYVEAHGTGTALGDPIEIRGLTEAFRKDTLVKQYCRIGSLKSNIGHLEAAAGVSGLIKIVLQMKHKKLVPSLGAEKLNPQIDFSNTPFVVQQSAEEWNPVDEQGNSLSRTACVSSFGAGGTNAHVVVEEYLPTLNYQPDSQKTYGPDRIVVLSGKNPERLQDSVKQLLAFMDECNGEYPFTLTDLAYTLQIGRVPLETRIAIEVNSLEELRNKLYQFLQRHEPIEGLFSGNKKEHKEIISLFANEGQLLELIYSWADSGNFGKLLSFWVKGIDLNWARLYHNARPRRISLPGYPFAKEFYGLPQTLSADRSASTLTAASIHPMVHRNTSGFSEQKFTTILSGEEFFLKDHVVKGERFFPGVGYLEMANVAMQVTVHNGELPPGEKTTKEILQLRNIAWVQPMVVNTSTKVHISLFMNDDEEVKYEIYSPSSEQQPGEILYGTGHVVLAKQEVPQVLDIDGLLNASQYEIIDAETCYRSFDEIGINYGSSHRAIEKIYVSTQRVLAKLVLPDAVRDTLEDFTLHPSLMDAALQSIIGFLVGQKQKYSDGWPLPVPFALEQLTIFSSCTRTMWACITINGNGKLTGNMSDFDTLSFDIALTDESGKICVHFDKYTARALVRQNNKTSGTVFLRTAWLPTEIPNNIRATSFSRRIIVACQGSGITHETIEGINRNTSLVLLASQQVSIAQRYNEYAVQLFKCLQEVLKSKPIHEILFQMVVPVAGEDRVLRGLFSMIRTASIENPLIHGQLLSLESRLSPNEIMELLDSNLDALPNENVNYKDGIITRAVHEEYSPAAIEKYQWKADGVYLITGGMGGLGFVFAQEILNFAEGATLILIGRTPINEYISLKLKKLTAIGGSVQYRQTDISNSDEVISLINEIQSSYGKLNGVIHCAGENRDSFIIRNSAENVSAVLAPKVQGLVNLDVATKNLLSDIFIIFSSSSSVIGNAGQADYAVANAFMDEYACNRNKLVSDGERNGHTVSISWPLWKEGGMKVSKEIESSIEDILGMTPMTNEAGLRAFYHAIAAGESHITVMHGKITQLRNTLLHQVAVKQKSVITTPDKSAAIETTPSNVAKGKALLYFRKLLSGVIKLPVDRIDPNASMEEYGIDSIMVTQLTTMLEKVFGSLPKTLFFEYQTIQEITGYFLKAHNEKMSSLLGASDTMIEQEALKRNKQRLPISDLAIKPRLKKHSAPGLSKVKTRHDDRALDIAIIGLAGQYPQARTLDEFWNNLSKGKNSITEIPVNRWNHELFFDEDKNRMGKTYTKWGGFLDGVDEFDSLFFNISPKEAEVLDPQERLFLQCAHAAFEDAGYSKETLQKFNLSGLAGNVGVFVGVMWEEYQLYGAQETMLGRPLVLSSSPSSIANRVSYYFNLHGPSIAIDTMCSSSLTSIHLACQSLVQGECEMAIAGGVNVSVHPNKYLVLGYGRFASSKGLCESFGIGGDGYVPGEGVGAVLLKPLSKAISDNDNIYAVIKGSAVNHGGKTNGFTVPNPSAQANVIDRAIAMANFDTRTISYLEAHGTGTSLGDPIEIAGLSKAFNTSENQYCSIGSVKSNIGHCESAAGISGLTKVLLQMKYRKLVPSLHSQVLNKNIDFENTPFIVQQTLQEWKRPVVKVGHEEREWPRRAGISSFGAGGSNSHILLEEYMERTENKNESLSEPALIILSARNEKKLKDQVRLLSQQIQNNSYSDADLTDIAYTLQIGREHMESRLAAQVTSISELIVILGKFIEDDHNVEGLFVGHAKSNKEILSLFTSDDSLSMVIDDWVRHKKHYKILEAWTMGLHIDWQALYSDTNGSSIQPRRISLPTYPFERQRHWPDIKLNHLFDDRGLMAQKLHPLVHQNTSTFSEQKFSSVFTGNEFFLKDHVIMGKKLLPAVAYLEMVNKAFSLAAQPQKLPICIEDVLWSAPFSVNGHPEKLDIVLTPEEDKISFRIFSPDAQHNVVHSQGKAKAVDARDGILRLDINQILKSSDHLLSGEECYSYFSSLGLVYGPAQQTIKQVYTRDNEVLTRLELPAAISTTIDHYCLHPSIMDGTLQSLIGFLFIHKQQNNIQPSIPFAAESINVLCQCDAEMWAYIRRVGQSITVENSGTEGVFDIDLVDNEGRICVQLRGLVMRRISEREVSSGFNDILLIEPEWFTKEIEVGADQNDGIADHKVIVIENADAAHELKTKFKAIEVLSLNSVHREPHETLKYYGLQVFNELKRLLKNKPKKKVLVQVLIPSNEEKQFLLAIAGLIKTAQLENPLLSGQVICNETGINVQEIISRVEANRYSLSDTIIRYAGNTRHIFGLREYETQYLVEPKHIWKDEGVYLITGGIGGLGLAFTREIANKVKYGKVILTGRSALSTEKGNQLAELRALGLTVEYLNLDVTDQSSCFTTIDTIVRKYGRLDGIIHSAGVLRDSLIIQKTDEEFNDVVAPKINGVVNLDLATRDITLDFFILCSSVAGVMGNVAQADYALANAYLDQFSSHRNTLVKLGSRCGLTVAMNWPLWRDGGMQVGEENEKILNEKYGMVPLQTAQAFKALYQAVTTGSSQWMVLQGNLAKLRQSFFSFPQQKFVNPFRNEDPLIEDQPPVSTITESERSVTIKYFRNLLSETLKLSPDQINPARALEEYGIDSVMIMRMTSELEKVFGTLPKTLFFEYQTIDELVEYFEEMFSDKVKTLSQNGERNQVLMNQTGHENTAAKHLLSGMVVKNRFQNYSIQVNEDVPHTDGIAIIGLSGSYPDARDIQDFWELLHGGKNCITEIPAWRWNHSRYFSETKNTPGKTYAKWGGFLEGIDEFDPMFFGITPKEAEIMDPQERLFLQCVYETLEDAGYTRETLAYNKNTGSSRNVGVYVGVMNEEYQLHGAEETALGNPLALSGNSATIANRVSYYFNFNGPSIALNTMCSSSLTTIHLACQSLLSGECDVAIAGGVNITVHPNKYIALSYGNFLSTKGLCESFGAGGNGYVPGEGVGAVLLKPLSKAVADNDHIYGVIRGTAINHSGKTNGYTVPNPKAQATVIERAMRIAGFHPETISYIEAHGTGTALGDPIEIAGLTKAFKTDKKNFCAIGSVKSNIGHCESAAGIAGITKVLLQMRNQKLVPTLHAESLNPNIDFINSPFRVQRTLDEWPKPIVNIDGRKKTYPRRAGISAFGAGGANAHILIEEYDDKPGMLTEHANTILSGPYLIVLSAKTVSQLKDKIASLIDWIERNNDQHWATISNMAYTLQTGREAMEERLAILAIGMQELKSKLIQFIESREDVEGLYRGKTYTGNSNEASNIDNDKIAFAVDNAIQTGMLTNLAGLWVNGAVVDWSALYKELGLPYLPRKISLPTYPFERRRCWFKDRVEADNHLDKETAPNNKVQSNLVLLKKEWILSTEVQDVCNQRVGIIYGDDTHDLANRLVQEFRDSILINVNTFGHIPEDDSGGPEVLIDLTGCDKSNTLEKNILYLQAFLQRQSKVKLNLIYVTKGLINFENTTVNLTGAAGAGLFHVLGTEYSRISSRHLDLDPGLPLKEQLHFIVAEASVAREQVEVCYRNGNPYIPKLKNVLPAAREIQPTVFSSDQVLLITGGTRGIGFLCAQHFVKKYGARKLVLMGQEELPPRDMWTQYRGDKTRIREKINKILGLEAQGVSVEVLSVDLTDKYKLDKAIRAIKALWGGIHGVIHCAGITDNTNPAFIRKSLTEIRRTLAPKVEGLNNLHECLGQESLSFFILFSSVSSAVPVLGAGQTSYAMANAYMDYFAGAMHHRSCPIISVQWPNWKTTGMGEVKTRAYTSTGFESLTDETGLHLLDTVLHYKPAPVVLPACIEPRIWNLHGLLNGKNKLSELTNASAVAPASSRDEPQFLESKVIQWLTELFSKELKIKPADLKIDRLFQDYGIDSILIMQLLQPIKGKLQLEMDPSILYEYASIKDFSAWLVKNYCQKLGEIFDASNPENNATPLNYLKATEPREKDPIMNNGPDGSSDIAVVGMTCRFPGAESLQAFWDLLSAGKSGISTIPPDRWKDSHGRFAGVLQDPFSFDSQFFLIPEKDAEAMDPQALMVLEESLKLFCHAGYGADEIKGKSIGVYLGGRSKHVPGAEQIREMRNPIVAAGQNYLSANVSQFFDLRGPSLTVDTACSSALVGMNMAISALQQNEIEAAVVGGVSILHSEEVHDLFAQRKILSKGKEFHIFDKRADGVVLGEGIGMVLLKTVSQAIQDGDQIYGLIKSVAINNDGRTAGPATPNIEAHKAVMKAALRKSNIKPERISYIETNGSGSEVTDLIELKGINAVYGSFNNGCALGSVKPNIGHPLCAEGIAGFIKVVLMLHHRRLVPFLSGQVPLKHFNLKATPFTFPRELAEWRDDNPVAAINCLADGGTNAHVIMEAFDTVKYKPVREPRSVPKMQRKNLKYKPESFTISSNLLNTKFPTEPAYVNIWEVYN